SGTAGLTILGRADGPPAAMKPGGAPVSAAVLSETGRRAAAQGGVDLPVEGALVAAAGAGRPQERADLEAALVQAGLARRVRVMADGEVALSTAFADGTGIIVSAGTGSIAYARDPAGQLHRAGGYGWQLGDEGGGYWLGRRALDVAARAQDGRGEGSTLLARLLGTLGLQTFDDLVRWTATASPAQVAALAPHVLNAAAEGEVVAQRVVEDAARELVALGARHVHRRCQVGTHVERGAAHVEDALHAVDYAHDLGRDADGDTYRHQWSERAAGYAGRADRGDDAHDHCDHLLSERQVHS